MVSWVLILHFGAWAGLSPTIPGYEERDTCDRAGRTAVEIIGKKKHPGDDPSEYVEYFCIPGPKH